jgi:hypothetical protein
MLLLLSILELDIQNRCQSFGLKLESLTQLPWHSLISDRVSLKNYELFG